jgi:hypothetical protein
MGLLRDWMPLSQEHSFHPLQSSVTQSIGHAQFPHDNDSAVIGHAAPAELFCTVIVRVRSRTPPPHVTAQPVHPVQSVTSQFIGGTQAGTSQLFESVNIGHSAPPKKGAIKSCRSRDRREKPHVAEQSDQGSHSNTEQSSGHSWLLHGA